MSEQNEPRLYHEERPLDRDEADQHVQDLAQEITAWILEHRPKKMSVLGIFGARGSGKTTVLKALGEELIKCEDNPVAIAARGENGKRKPILFEPEKLSPEADVVLALVEHLMQLGKPEETVLSEINEALARRRMPDQFLQVAKDLATSDKDFGKRLVKFHKDLARVEEDLREGVEKIVKVVRENASGGATSSDAPIVVFLIDDVDLAQRWAFTLLETLYRCFCHSGVIAVITADRPQLVSSIRCGLRRDDHDLTQDEAATLAEAMLDKLVPYRWSVPVPLPDQRIRFLSSESEDKVQPVLHRFWAESLRADLAAAASTREREFSGEDWIEELLGPLLPSTWRLLKALHNQARLSAERVDPGEERPLAMLYQDDKLELYPVRESGLGPAAWPAMESAVNAVSLEYPELDLDGLLNRNPGELFEILRQRAALHIDELHDERRQTRRAALDRQPVEARLRRLQPIEHRAVADLALDGLAYLHQKLVEASQRTPVRDWYLAISFNADAWEKSRELWEGRVPTERQFHLDLSNYAPTDGSMPDVERIKNAIDETQPWLREKKLEAASDLHLFAYAPLSFMTWLGWRLYRAPQVVVTNWYGNEFNDFQGPAKAFSGLRRKQLDFVRLRLIEGEPTGSTGAGAEAVLVVAGLRPLGTTVFSKFPKKVLERCGYLWCLERSTLGDIEPDMLLDLLGDVVLAIERLKDEHQVETIHLGMMVPAPVAFFIGQQLHSLRPIVLYEYYPNKNPAKDKYHKVRPLEGVEAAEPDDVVVRRGR